MITDLFAAACFYILPLLTGRIFFKPIAYSFATGMLIWYLALLISGIYFPGSFDNVIILLTGISVLLFFLRIIRDIIKDRNLLTHAFSLNSLITPSFILLLTVFSFFSYFFVWKLFTPYPMQLNWDIYEHITVANIIASGQTSFLPSFLTDTFTFNGYTTLFHTALAAQKSLFQTDLLGFYWWVEYWHYLLTIVASFLLAKNIFKKTEISLLAGVVSGLVYESSMVYSNLFLIPQTMTALLGIFILREVIISKEDHTDKPFFKKITGAIPLIISLITALFLHFVIGFAVICTVIAFKILDKEIFTKHLNKISLFFVFILIGTLSLQFFGGIDLTGREEANYFNLGLVKIAALFSDWYGLTLIFLVPGIIGILKSHNITSKKILVLALITATVSLAPFAYFLKYYTLSRYLVNTVLVFGIFYAVRNFSVPVRYLYETLTVLVFTAVFFINVNTYQNFLFFSNVISHISDKELDTSKWLRANYNKDNTLIVSDPGTQYILEASSEINTPGGAYMSLPNRNKLININDGISPEIIELNLKEIKDRFKKDNAHLIFVASGRYFAWQKLTDSEKKSFYFNIWSPRVIEQTDVPFLTRLAADSSFKIIYQNNEMVIFEIL
jgi:hypothetical protein